VTYLFDPPQVFQLPLTMGRDIHFDFKYKPLVVDVDGEPVLGPGGKKQYALADYPAGAVVTLEIDTDPQTVGIATITGHHAVVSIDYTIADEMGAQLPWRIKMVTGSVDNVLAQGKTVRKDA
jgi:hypothetical protein